MKKIFFILFLILAGLNSYSEQIVINNNFRIASPGGVIIYFEDATALDDFCTQWGIIPADFNSWNDYFASVVLASTTCTGVIVSGNSVEFLNVSHAFKIMSGSISGLPPYPNLTGIEINAVLDTLDIQQMNDFGTNITSLDVNTVPSLVSVVCPWCNLSNILTTNNPALEVLNTYIGSTGGVNVSNNPNLVELTLSGSLITSIDVTGNPLLRAFVCNDCQELTSVDLSTNHLIEQIQLQRLNMNNGGTSSIILPNTPTLIGLDVSSNSSLTTIDLSPYIHLYSLEAESTLLTTINTTTNTELNTFKIHGSSAVTTIDLSTNVALLNVDVSSTGLNVTQINNMFIALDASGLTGGYVKYTGQPLPTGPGLTAKNNLVSKSWTVIH